MAYLHASRIHWWAGARSFEPRPMLILRGGESSRFTEIRCALPDAFRYGLRRLAAFDLEASSRLRALCTAVIYGLAANCVLTVGLTPRAVDMPAFEARRTSNPGLASEAAVFPPCFG